MDDDMEKVTAGEMLESPMNASSDLAEVGEEVTLPAIETEPAEHKHGMPRGFDLFSWESWGLALLVLFLVILTVWGIWPLLLVLLIWLAL